VQKVLEVKSKVYLMFFRAIFAKTLTCSHDNSFDAQDTLWKHFILQSYSACYVLILIALTW